MNCCNCNCNQVPFVDGYVPYLMVTNITVGTAAVNLSMGDRNIAPTGTIYVRIGTAIPTGTEASLPVTLSLNGNTRQLTLRWPTFREQAYWKCSTTSATTSSS